MGRPPKGSEPSGHPEVTSEPHRVAQERTRPGEALPVTAALAHEAPRVACASAGLAAAATPAGQEVFAPSPGAASYTQPDPPPWRTGPGAASARTRLGSRPPRDVPPPHNPRSLTPGPDSSSASSSSSHSQAGMARTLVLAPVPASRLRGAVRTGWRRTGRGRRKTARRCPGFSERRAD